MGKKIPKKIYLDYAASTPVASEVLKAMKPFWSEQFGNPGSLHSFGQEAMTAVDQSREQIAKLIGAQFREIIFTGSATEANNLVLRGTVMAWRKKNPHLTPRIIVSTIEHEAILETARSLEGEGVEVVYLPVDSEGVVRMSELNTSLNERTVLVSIMYGNNEVGTIQPIEEIAKVVGDFRKEKGSLYPLLHTDAAQVFLYRKLRVDEVAVDYATFSGHKMYSPKGVGVLYARQLTQAQLLSPVMTGGGQEFGFRSGTENVPFIVGLARGMVLGDMHREKETKRLYTLKDFFFKELKKIDRKILLNGPAIGRGLPHILSISFSKMVTSDLLVYLDLHGVAVSTGSACQARSPKPSHVLKALDFEAGRINRSMRLSFGRGTTSAELSSTVRVIKERLGKR